MARGVRSSGSTLMPPVHSTSSAPAASIRLTAAVIWTWSSSRTSCQPDSQPYSASFSWMTGEKVSSMRPWYTSLPVMIRPYRRGRKGSSRSRGPSPAACRAASIFSFSMTRGMTRVPHSLSPRFTGKPELRVAIIISPRRFTARSRSTSASSRPSSSATSSIFPSLGAVACMLGPWHRAVSYTHLSRPLIPRGRRAA